MKLELSPELRSLRAQLRAYLPTVVNSDVRNRLSEEPHGGPAYREVIAQLGADGWLGIGWPTEYGGQGRSALAQYIFFDETQRARVPVPMIALNTVGPTLMEHGSDAQRSRYLPGILQGQIDFAIGYSEPGAGTDLASLRTRARRQGDGWIVNGNKVYTSRGSTADHIWLAARTRDGSQGHDGISILIVDTDAPGFTARPIHTLAGYETYATFYDDVHVPGDALVGPVHGGWRLITTQLNHERVGMAAFSGIAFRLFEDTLSWARATPAEGERRVIDLAWVQHALARAHALLEPLELLNWRMAWHADHGSMTPADSSSVKVLGTETVIEVYRLLMGVLGSAATLPGTAAASVLGGDLEWAYRRAVINTFGGGANEVQREIIARAGLGLPRVPR